MPRRRKNRGPASRLTSGKKHVILKGRQREGAAKRPRQPEWVGLLRRLRRLELAIVYMVEPKGLDVDLRNLVKDIRARTRDEGEALEILFSGPRQGEGEGNDGVDG